MHARTIPRRTALAASLLLALVLVTSAHAVTDDEPDTADGVRKLLRYLRCAFEIALAYDWVTAGAAATDCTNLYLTEAH